MADAQGGGQFGQRGVSVGFNARLKFGGVEFAPGAPARFGRQRVRFVSGKVAVNGTFAQLEPPRGFRPRAAALHKFYHPRPQIQRVSFHSHSLPPMLPM